ncbi:threonylcarbamoyladenosine tRNA methylthiotransferase MtaB [Breznakibacter xylanolyticus]|uniref:Threonylcarbamoyladenosine tRNA methylthiotransferase MtaB n=1 Tax=Breznakibacter xylanolyticus TaxID=990 RepID=A0A2W7NRG0_9BACT|nr:tRNA (N(6)-L-threonylcarbamoyladenosine(37)-C(2))-methylthiotransferase MtaB [Breznakibacter xylanolyticus]MBN2742345.1 tRNA (N(6)-L-threonylcarbamoyladenosine(37)-C(2))-methylthiotransferase MtaB [Marinilabiliaceae bacterium]PZX20687.1 threonylcarbamoyladenosine tRNA methylthiotransferase MtaB [Breznakibacter xylanolyticus]
MIDRSVFHEKKAAFHTLGCKLNFSETSTIARTMMDDGFTRVDFNERADVYVINTCTVTEIAEKKCRAAIHKAIRQNPDAFVVVTGCFAQLRPENIAKIPGVDLILGSNEKFDITAYLGHLDKNGSPEIHTGKIKNEKTFHPSYSMGDRTRCFLKVQDGCDYFCSYCTIPMARGRSRNASVANTIKMAQQAAAEGAREIILTGVNIGDFGRSTNETFLDLIRELDKIESIWRYRVSSIEPNLLTPEIIAFMAESKKFMPHFHIPLQSGSDNVLRLMQRKYNTALFQQRIDTIRQLLPDAFIGVDVIVGVRGESEQDFADTHAFLSQLDVSQLHVFTYSERPNTKALNIETPVSPEERKHRSQVLHLLSDKKTDAFYRRFINTSSVVLPEGQNDDGYMYGYTDNYIKVELPYNSNLVNTLQNVDLLEFNTDRSALKARLK